MTTLQTQRIAVSQENRNLLGTVQEERVWEKTGTRCQSSWETTGLAGTGGDTGEMDQGPCCSEIFYLYM